MKRRLFRALCTALVFALLCAPALAERARISLGGKLGLMYEGDEATLKPRLKGVSAGALEWSSSDSEAVKVDGGRVTAKAAGRAIITVRGGGAKARCGVVVLPRQVEIEAGERYALPNGTLEKYAVQDGAIAKVSDRGVISGLKAGETLVRVRHGKQTLFVQLKVRGAEGGAQQSAAAELDCADTASQIVLVDHAGGSKARLSIHEKKSGVWKERYACTAYLGKAGIGKTREGDQKTPTGTYNLTQPFGIKADPGANMPYTQVTKNHYWCGSSGSEYYNRLVDMREVDRKVTSSDEYLINYKGYYDYCMFIDYNAEGAAGKGSCIFLHCIGGKKSTGGCIAVPEDVMKQIVRWAKPGAKIVIR